MEHIINITQTLRKTGAASYEVDIEANGKQHVFYYRNSNSIYPLYNSLINTLDDYEKVTINLTTSDPRFGKEIQGNPGNNTTMLDILLNIKERKEIVINVL